MPGDHTFLKYVQINLKGFISIIFVYLFFNSVIIRNAMAPAFFHLIPIKIVATILGGC